jgi:HEAT repeat protein
MNDRLAIEWERALAAEGITPTTESLMAALVSPHMHIRIGSATILGRRGEVKALSYLKPLLKDRPLVRVEAAMSLYLLGDKSGIPALIEILDSDLIAGTPVTAARYLANIGDPRGFKIVLKALRSDLDGTRLMAAVALKSFVPYHDKEIDGHKVDLLLVIRKALKYPNSLVRRQLLFTLAKLDDHRSKLILSSIARSDRNARVRLKARQLLSPNSDE